MLNESHNSGKNNFDYIVLSSLYTIISLLICLTMFLIWIVQIIDILTKFCCCISFYKGVNIFQLDFEFSISHFCFIPLRAHCYNGQC